MEIHFTSCLSLVHVVLKFQRVVCSLLSVYWENTTPKNSKSFPNLNFCELSRCKICKVKQIQDVCWTYFSLSCEKEACKTACEKLLRYQNLGPNKLNFHTLICRCTWAQFLDQT